MFSRDMTSACGVAAPGSGIEPRLHCIDIDYNVMRRLHLFEFGDQRWFPQILRDAETAYLASRRQSPGSEVRDGHRTEQLDRVADSSFLAYKPHLRAGARRASARFPEKCGMVPQGCRCLLGIEISEDQKARNRQSRCCVGSRPSHL